MNKHEHLNLNLGKEIQVKRKIKREMRIFIKGGACGWRTITVAAPPTAAQLKASRKAAKSAATRPADAMTSDRLPATKTYGTRFTTKTKTTSSKTSTKSSCQRLSDERERQKERGRNALHRCGTQSKLHELPASENNEKNSDG